MEQKYADDDRRPSVVWYSLLPCRVLVNTNGFKDIGDRQAQKEFWNNTPINAKEFLHRYSNCSAHFGLKNEVTLFQD